MFNSGETSAVMPCYYTPNNKPEWMQVLLELRKLMLIIHWLNFGHFIGGKVLYKRFAKQDLGGGGFCSLCQVSL